MEANIIIEVTLDGELLDPEDSTGVTAEAYDLIMDALSGIAMSVSVYKA